MNIELENKLAETFSFMRRNETVAEQRGKENRIYDLYGAFGCETDDGWYELLYSLCSEITEAYKKHGQPVDIVVDQIKEKFGTLRFYYHYEGSESGANAVDFLGTGSIRLSDKSNELRREIADIVDKWEERSAQVCEKCGKPGTLRSDLPWILTLCDDCYEAKKKR